jgi:catechol 2,3-dioxygenase-like lactoylglutathione lyase family enzyme
MKSALYFAAGIAAGVLITHTVAAQDSAPRALSHVGIAVTDFDRALAYYTKTMGLREAYSLKQPDGRPLLTYLHVNRDTFVELIPATAAQPPGITHFAIEFGSLDAAVARMRQQGATLPDVGLTPGKARFTRATDPDGVSIELMEFGPGSQQRRAMEAYK